MSPLASLRDTPPHFPPLSGVIAAFTFFILTKYIYRVTIHPLATFPGPKLAALTNLYGAFYDLLPNRSYCKQFPDLHDRYGLRNVPPINDSCQLVCYRTNRKNMAQPTSHPRYRRIQSVIRPLPPEVILF